MIDDISTTSYTPTQALSKQTGHWWIRSSDAIGNRGWSLAGTFDPRTEVLAPVGTQSTSNPTFSWVAVERAGRYILHVTNLDTNTFEHSGVVEPFHLDLSVLDVLMSDEGLLAAAVGV